MSYAVRNDGQGWRSVNGLDDVGPDEQYSTEQPAPIVQDPKDAIRAQMEELERQQLMPRATREFMLMFMEANATPEILAVNPGYQAVKAFDNEIKVLRAQL
jgi:hypothetical protein